MINIRQSQHHTGELIKSKVKYLYSTIKLVAASVLLGATSLPLKAVSWGIYGRALDYYPGTFEEQISHVKELGLTTYRIDLQSESQFKALEKLLAVSKRYGIKILPTLQIENRSTAWSEDEVYKKSRSFAQSAVSRFKKDINVWEMGAETEQWAMVRPGEIMDNGARWALNWGDPGGDSYNHYVAARYNKVRGLIRGLCDGAHAADPNAKCIVNTAGWLHYAFLQRLISDRVNFDITGYHWYSQMGNIENANPNKNGVGTNIAAVLARMGKPIWITECNRSTGSKGGKEQEQAQYIQKFMTQMKNIADRYGIKNVMIYELMDEPYIGLNNFEAYMGLIHSYHSETAGGWLIGSHKPAFNTVKNFLKP